MFSINSSNFHPCFEKENILLPQGTQLGNRQGSVLGQSESPGPVPRRITSREGIVASLLLCSWHRGQSLPQSSQTHTLNSCGTGAIPSLHILPFSKTSFHRGHNLKNISTPGRESLVQGCANSLFKLGKSSDHVRSFSLWCVKFCEAAPGS